MRIARAMLFTPLLAGMAQRQRAAAPLCLSVKILQYADGDKVVTFFGMLRQPADVMIDFR